MPSDSTTAAVLNLISERLNHVSDRSDKNGERMIELVASAARAETNQLLVIAHLERLNGTVAAHDKRLDTLERGRLIDKTERSGTHKRFERMWTLGLLLIGAMANTVVKHWFPGLP